MKPLIRTEWEKDHYPFIDLRTFQMSSIPKAEFHILMNTQPGITVKDPSKKNLELLFKITVTKLLATYEMNQNNVEFGDFISDAYLIFFNRFEKYDNKKSNWFSYCKYIGFDIQRKYKLETNKRQFFVLMDLENVQTDEDTND
jgi:hypothetical protein